MVEMQEQDVYAAIGEQGFARLVAAFYARVPQDPILGEIYRGRDLAAAEQHLRDFLIYRFGGPQRYLEQRGHPRLRMRHAPFVIDEAARNRWMEVMTAALEESVFAAELHSVLLAYLGPAATAMINHD
jgi:hemoglobin